jgi:hypothetical protein
MTRRIAFCLAALAIARCASTPLSPEADLRHPAILQDADQVPTPVAQAIHSRLQRARAEIAVAKQMELEGDRRSEVMWARAQADTELALGLMREGAVHLAAGEATQALGLSQLNNEASAP